MKSLIYLIKIIPLAIFISIAILIALDLLIVDLDEKNSLTLIIILINTVIIILLITLYKYKLKRIQEYNKKNLLLLHSLFKEHAKELNANRKRLSTKKYGYIEDKKWQKELDLFIRTVIYSGVDTNWYFSNKPFIYQYIDEKLNMYEDGLLNSGIIQYDKNCTPEEYELFCAYKLIQNGWDAETTIGSGDHGADVIATKDGKKLIVQCKKWSASVGNKAVQEVYSAKDYYDANIAAVVSNAPYTPAAKTIASKLDVMLLHHDQLDDI